MRLARIEGAPAWGDLAAFERLDTTSTAPVCVAVSGGGDSLAALIHTCAWAERAGRPVLALSVDHGLQPASGGWTAFAGQMARRLGANFQALAWEGEKPATGIPAAARQARHVLIAEAARAAGARAIVTGHTADDQAENAALGQGVLREWSASPVWPEGREVFLLRPLLGMSRAAIRADLRAGGWTWIDDPANEDLRQPRARVRTAGAKPSPVTVQRPMTSIPRGGAADALQFGRSIECRALAFAAVCVGGGSRLPRAAEVGRLVQRLRSGERFVATLCGSRIDAGETVVFTREPGRAGLPGLELPVGRTLVWDGRYELLAERQGLAVKALAGHASKLSPQETRLLRRIDARARGALPLIQGSDGTVFCPVLAGNNVVRVRSLVRERFLSAYGAIETEPRGL